MSSLWTGLSWFAQFVGTCSCCEAVIVGRFELLSSSRLAVIKVFSCWVNGWVRLYVSSSRLMGLGSMLEAINCIRPSSGLVAGCALAAPQPQSAELLPRNVMLGFVPTAGVSVTVCGFVGAKGSVGTTMSRLVICVRCSRTTHQDRQSRLRKTHCLSPSWLRHTCQDTVLWLPSLRPHWACTSLGLRLRRPTCGSSMRPCGSPSWAWVTSPT